MNSLRRRLLLWLLPSTFVVGALASVGTYWGATLELADLLDEQLRYVAEHVSLDGERLTVDKTNEHKRRLSDERADEVLVEVWQGQRLSYTSDAALHLPPPTRMATAPTRAPAPAADTAYSRLRSRIEQACADKGRELELYSRGPGSLLVRVKVAKSADAELVANRISQLPELAPYRVSFEMRVGQ